jgi:hypothetical protein
MYKYTSELRADELGISIQFIYSNRDVYTAIALCSS